MLSRAFRELGDKVEATLETTIRAVRDADQSAAADVLTIMADIDPLIAEALEPKSKVLAETGPEQIEIIRMEMTVLENLKRIHTCLKRIAREIVQQEVRI
ncbi:MAG: PhoU domain-containing protein [Pseudomonadota bacterium]